MSSTLSTVLLVLASVREVTLPSGTVTSPIRVECPAEQTTRLVFPERLSRVTASAGAREAMGIAVESYRPFGVMTVRPARMARPARLEIAGPSMRLVLELRAVAQGSGSEIRFSLAGASLTAAPPIRSRGTSASPEPAEATGVLRAITGATEPRPEEAASTGSPNPFPAAHGVIGAALDAANPPAVRVEAETSSVPGPPPDVSSLQPVAATDASTLLGGLPSAPAPPVGGEDPDLRDVLSSRPQRISRREGLPGQKQVVLVDALKGEAWVFLRFLVEDGAEERVAVAMLGDRALDIVVQAPEEKGLRVVVQVPSAEITRKSRVTLKLVSGAEYKFALTSGTLTAFLKGLFR